MNSSGGNSSGIPAQVKGSVLTGLFRMPLKGWLHQFHQDFGPFIRTGIVGCVFICTPDSSGQCSENVLRREKQAPPERIHFFGPALESVWAIG